jgi:hypothetical protein
MATSARFAIFSCCLVCSLKYLLSQSDIFAHFGSGKSKPPDPKKEIDKKRGRGRPPSGNNGNNFDELDDDEKAIAKEIGSDEDEAESAPAAGHNTVLMAQPSCISGGQMR